MPHYDYEERHRFTTAQSWTKKTRRRNKSTKHS